MDSATTGNDRAPGDVTQLLALWKGGEREALDRLIPLVYEELRLIAGGFLRRECQGATLQPTGLVDEAFLKLVDQTRTDWKSSAHFLGAVASIIRNILVDYARVLHPARRSGTSPALSPSTVKRDWALAKAWIFHTLPKTEPAS